MASKKAKKRKKKRNKKKQHDNTSSPLWVVTPLAGLLFVPKGLSCVPKEHAEGGSKLASVSSKTKHHPRRHKF